MSTSSSSMGSSSMDMLDGMNMSVDSNSTTGPARSYRTELTITNYTLGVLYGIISTFYPHSCCVALVAAVFLSAEVVCCV
jgi:hypothetical protein